MPRSRSAAGRVGQRFERQAQARLAGLGPQYFANVWFAYRFVGEVSSRKCALDGLWLDLERGLLMVVEIKLRHCEQAVRQLDLYGRVVRRAFGPGWTIRTLELCRHYDPATYTGQAFHLAHSFEDTLACRVRMHQALLYSALPSPGTGVPLGEPLGEPLG